MAAMLGTLPLLFMVVLVLLAWMWRRPSRFPPGPTCWPLMGSFFAVPKKDLHLTLMRWKDEYGPLVGAMFGPRRVVLVAGPREVLEVLRRDEFAGRPRMFFFKERSFRKLLGVVFSDGPFWTEQRRFALRHLRDFGFGKTSMDNIMHEEVDELSKVLLTSEIHPVSRMFNQAIVNLLWTIVAGRRFSYEDSQFQEILGYVYKSFRSDVPGGVLVNVFPFLRFVIPRWSGYEEGMEYVHGLQGMLRESIREHEKSFTEGYHRDFIDVYLEEIRNKKNLPETTFTEEGLIVLCMDLFIAGSDTVSNTLEFCLLYMVLYPGVQLAVQREMEDVLGRSIMPSAGDRTRLPYTEAVLTEVMRINTIVPVPPPHRCMKKTELQGYTIPEDTMVFVNLWALLHDREHWGDPHVFRPERFLDAEGRFARDDWCCVFSLGKRTCLGESLARNALFVVFTSLLQRFEFSLPAGDPAPSTKGRLGLTSTPEPFRVKVTPRGPS
ncbi:methyl farnesoate epoxidase-like [Bacillus rossius redtenbacheri]|uniref:methyl farnesoate epoxidase-like n=1 Tax=Bacillus rossius redtenbacheri TaxID=93214 RepID=UPI002FDCBA50